MKRNKQNKGITLIETVVALAIFGFIATIAVNIFVSELKEQRKSLALQAIQNDARYALELMSREVRMSHVEVSTEDVLNINAFKSGGASESVTYSLSGGQILRNGISVISPDSNVSRLKFYLRNQANPPALLTIVMTIESKGTKIEEQARLDLQTTICSRDYND